MLIPLRYHHLTLSPPPLSEANREILWNVSTTPNIVTMYLLLALSVIIGLVGVIRRAELWLGGKPDPEHTGSYLDRFFDLFSMALMQRGTNRRPEAALFHLLIYLGFLALLFATTMIFIDYDLGIPIYHGRFYLGVTVVSDVLGFGLLVGCALAAHRRIKQQSDLVHRRWSESIILIFLAVLVIQGFALEGLRIHATRDPWAAYSPIGYLVAQFLWGLSAKATAGIHYVMWWFHTVTVFAAVALFPYTKFFHILASSANLYFQKRARPQGALSSPGDIEKLMETSDELTLGLGTIQDYTWKQLMDLDACTSCGRCQDACPAYLSGKILSPKWMILDTRNHLLTLHAQKKFGPPSVVPEILQTVDRKLILGSYLEPGGVTPSEDGTHYTNRGAYRALNELVQSGSRKLGESAEARIAGDVMDPDVFWSCTTCMACVEACPVGIDHVDQIVGNRRNMALMHGEIPTEAQATLRKLENQGNPYGDPNDRMRWAEGLNLTVLKPGDTVDYLYWVGCVSAFDPRKQKIARAMVTLMQAAGLSFGVLGKEESCTGDPARRLGEENLFQMLAKKNIATLQNVKFKTIVANCPHCFNTLRNEYPQFGSLGEGCQVIHHSQLLRELAQSGKLPLSRESSKSYTFHDPCYLGRYNKEYDAPRDTLTAVPNLSITEMTKSRNKGLCCGAGGGHFWMDLKVGQRINAIRTDQAAETGAERIATACPFCMQMMEDGVKLTGREAQMDVRDIAEVLVESLELSSAEPPPIDSSRSVSAHAS